MTLLHSFLWLIVHCVYVADLLYQLLCGCSFWTLASFPVVNSVPVNVGVRVF